MIHLARTGRGAVTLEVKSARALLLRGTCLMVLVFFLAQTRSTLGDVFGDERVETSSIGAKSYPLFNRQTEPTAPLAAERPVGEWEAASFVWINLSLPSVCKQPEVLAFYREFIEVVSQYLPVVVGLDFQSAWSWPRLREELVSDAAAKRGNTHFFDSRCNSYWTRDYGPGFARAADDSLILVDSMYRGLEDEMDLFASSLNELEGYSPSRNALLFQAFRSNGRRAELAPLRLANVLRQYFGYTVDCVRPKLYLQGGDFLTDGKNRVFISEDTLISNGGRESALAETFRYYFGAKEMHVLSALPGNAVKHLDMNLKFISPNVLLYAEPPKTRKGGSRSSRQLETLATRSLESNIAYLRERCSDVTLVPIPTPPIWEESVEEAMLVLSAQVLQLVCKELDVDFDSYWYVEKPGPDHAEVKEKVDTRLASLVGHPARLSNRSDLNRLTLHYLKEDLDTLIDSRVAGSTVYRTYANALLIQVENGPTVALLPRYRAQEGESSAAFRGWEMQVERAYRLVYPNAKIHWIPTDAMALQGGALHCLAMVVPQGKRR
ncbi:agmatine deiminase family protein [Pelagicoccus sp. SDUM812003]|uniref:agmatine deiminase family protein n=1 Tax=Pelagicoccus sp. SDUM812003 TaxID=3041267 RepID=UPI00280C6339|nr:agmatine deiminase family protein [Pelagicoccus sp. SDUM812003]MDQ8204701.1 agmatine deiminase family protein [Pelagicoccus sp. SDUM812003]